MFPRRTAAAQPIRSAQPIRGTAWSITDEALTIIDEQIAVHTAERGGALITTREGRIVVDFIADPRPGEQISYWHSPALQQTLTKYLREHPTRRYGGTLHSHPGTYAEPSGPDHEAFSTQLANNPTIREALFPIVVQAKRANLGSVLRLGENHLINLANGTLAAYSAVPNSDTVDVRPAPLHVIPLHRDVRHASTQLSRHMRTTVTTGPVFEVEIEGQYLPAVSVDANGEHLCTIVFPATYPTTAPILLCASGATNPAWWISEDTAAQLADALISAILRTRPSYAPTETMESRLVQHLPDGVEARYLVVGAGSVGSNVAELLIRSGVKDITIVDFDTVELPNLSRTIYTRADIGALKVTALARRLKEINPDIVVTQANSSIQDLDLDHLDGIEVAVMASDDLAAEFWLGHHLYHRGISSISIKMFERGDAGELVVTVPNAGTACLRCVIGDAVGNGRGETDYGTGRLVSAPALGADIVATVSRGVRVALALGQRRGPLTDWLEPLITRSHTYFQQSSIADYPTIAAFRTNRTSSVFDALWVRTESQVTCSVCGPNRESPDEMFGGLTVPTTPPPGVTVTNSTTPVPYRPVSPLRVDSINRSRME